MIYPHVYRWLRRHQIVCFLLMTVSFIVFGYLTIDLIRLVTLNATLVLEHGALALMDGGAQQFVELWLNALLAMGMYLSFKLCEQVLLHVLCGTNPPKMDGDV